MQRKERKPEAHVYGTKKKPDGNNPKIPISYRSDIKAPRIPRRESERGFLSEFRTSEREEKDRLTPRPKEKGPSPFLFSVLNLSLILKRCAHARTGLSSPIGYSEKEVLGPSTIESGHEYI